MATAPTLTEFGPAVVFLENLVNLTPQLLDADVAFADPDEDFDGGSLTVSGLLAEDVVSVLGVGTGAGEVGFDPATGEVTYGGATIGTAVGGAGADLVVAFNAAATSEAIEALIESLSYANISDTPNAVRTLTLDLVDGAGLHARLGPDAAPAFSRQIEAADPFLGLDFGKDSKPALGDLDGDGDIDCVVGESAGVLHYLENTGSAAAAAFVERSEEADPFLGQLLGAYAAPALVDLDGDGDLDVAAGNRQGVIKYLENTGTAASPQFELRAPADNPLYGIDPGGSSTPAFADLDGDGDFDLTLGERYGALVYFENVGSASAASFQMRAGAGNPLAGFDLGYNAIPSFVDLDGDGDLDAVVGAEYGALNYLENTGTAAAAVYVQRTGQANPFRGVDVGVYDSPSFADLDGDGDADLVVGDGEGGVSLFLNEDARAFIEVEVTAENDAPAITASAGLSVGVNVLTALTGVEVSDPDSGGAWLTVTLAADVGFLTVSAGAGLQVEGDGTGVLTLRGSQYDLSNAFASGLLLYAADLLGDATLTISVDDGGATGGDPLGDVETIAISVLDVGIGGEGTDLFTGLAERNRLEGMGGDDVLTGSTGADMLAGGGGDDLLRGGMGGDRLEGGAGRDTASYADAAAGVRVSLAKAGEQNTIGAGRDTLASVERLVGSGYADLLTGDGRANRLDGGAGDDVLSGGGGGDLLLGGLGRDRLVGGAGGDTLSGGFGRDDFVFAAGDFAGGAADLIVDLGPRDRIDLSAIDADATLAGDQAFSVVERFGRTAGEARLSYDAEADQTRLLLDLDGDGRADRLIRLAGDQTGFDGFVL